MASPVAVSPNDIVEHAAFVDEELHAVRRSGSSRSRTAPDAGLATHDSGVCGDAFVGHELMLAAAASPGTRRSPGASR